MFRDEQITAWGKTHAAMDWSAITGITMPVLYKRLKKFSPEIALSSKSQLSVVPEVRERNAALAEERVLYLEKLWEKGIIEKAKKLAEEEAKRKQKEEEERIANEQREKRKKLFEERSAIRVTKMYSVLYFFTVSSSAGYWREAKMTGSELLELMAEGRAIERYDECYE